MNWEAIGAVGEVLGALGVIATLSYLAVQIRQNTRTVRSATHQASVGRSDGRTPSRRAERSRPPPNKASCSTSNWRATGESGDGVQVPAKSGEKR